MENTVTGDMVVGQTAMEQLVRGFLKPINPSSNDHHPPLALGSADRFCISMCGRIPHEFADRLLHIVQEEAQLT